MKSAFFSLLFCALVVCSDAQSLPSADRDFFQVPSTQTAPGRDQIDSALSRCSGGSGGVVILPPSMKNDATWSMGKIPRNCQIWDLRYHSLDIFSDEVDNREGHSAGLGVFIGEQIPAINPVRTNPVGIYTAINMRKPVAAVWGMNYVVNVASEGGAAGIEGDLGLFVPEDYRFARDQIKFVGGSPNPVSTVLRIGGAHGTHRTGFRMDGVSTASMGNIPETRSDCLPKGVSGYGCLGTYEPWRAILAENVSPSSELQVVKSSVPIDGLAGNWMWISCDKGDRQENVYPISVSDTTFKAVFSKPHAAGAVCHWYGALAGINLGNSYFQNAPIILGNLYGTIEYGMPHFPSISIYDATSKPGSEMLRDVLLFDRSSHLILRSVGTGVRFEDKQGNQTVSVDETGNVASHGRISGSSVLTNRGTPSSSTDRCSKGELWTDERYVYVCVADNRIKRSPLESF